MTQYPFLSRLDIMNELERIADESGQLEGREKRVFAKALLILLRESL